MTGHVTKPLSDEAANTLQKNWTDNSGMHPITACVF